MSVADYLIDTSALARVLLRQAKRVVIPDELPPPDIRPGRHLRDG